MTARQGTSTRSIGSELDALLKLPGKARRDTPEDEIVIPSDALPLAGPHGPPTGLTPEQLGGVVVDDRDAQKEGKWTEGTGPSRLRRVGGICTPAKGLAFASPSRRRPAGDMN